MGLRSLIKGQFSDSFSRTFLRLGGANAGAHLITIGAAPFLARIYEPAWFGIYGIYLVVCAFGISIGCLRLESALLLTRSARKVRVLLSGCILASVVMGIVIGDVAGLYFYFVSPASAFPIWIGIAGAFICGLNTLFSALALREQNFKGLARSRLAQSASTVALQFAFGFAGMSAMGLILGDALGRLLGAVQLFLQSKNRTFSAPHPVLLKSLVSEQRALIYFSFPNTVLNTLALQAPALFITPLFGVAANGYYVQAQRLAAAPLVLIGQALGQVFGSELAARWRARQRGLVALFWNSIRKSTILGGAPLLVAFATAPWWVPAFFGKDWAPTGFMILVLTPLSFAQMITSPISQAPTILGFQRSQMKWEVVRLLFLALVFPLAGLAVGLSLMPTLLLYSAGSAILYLGFVLICLKEIKKADNL